MNDENAILAYYQGIRDGSIVVGKWIRLLYEMILDGIEDKTWFFNQRKASTAIRFIERFAHHYKGAMAPQRVKLELFQRAAISCIFGLQLFAQLRVRRGGCGKIILIQQS